MNGFIVKRDIAIVAPLRRRVSYLNATYENRCCMVDFALGF